MPAVGIVAVGDIANSEVSVPVKQKSLLLYHTFFELFGLDPAKADSVLPAGITLQESALAMGASSVVPHAPYSVSEKLFRLIGEQLSLLSIHNQARAQEVSFFLDGTG